MSDFVSIKIDGDFVVAGDRVSGEVFVNSSSVGNTVVFLSSGTEKLITTSDKGQAKSMNSSIFEYEHYLSQETSDRKEVFPFRFKIPAFCPSSLEIDQINEDEQHVKAEISYNITARLKNSSGTLAEKSIKLIVFSKNTRETLKTQESTQTLKSCLCFSRGTANLTVLQSKATDILSEDEVRYKILLKSKANKHLESIVGQIYSEFSSKSSGADKIKLIKNESRIVVDLKTLLSESENNSELYVDLDFKVNQEENRRNAPTCNARYFTLRYIMKVLAVYGIGWRSKIVELNQEVVVGPKLLNDYEEYNELSDAVYQEVQAFEAPIENKKYYEIGN